MRDRLLVTSTEAVAVAYGEHALVVDTASAEVTPLKLEETVKPPEKDEAAAPPAEAAGDGAAVEPEGGGEAKGKKKGKQKKAKNGAAPQAASQAKPIVEGIAFSADGSHVAAIYGHKMLGLWRSKGGQLVAQRSLPKKPMAVLFASMKGRDVLVVADKVGDVRAYPADANIAKESALLLGHTASIVTTLDLRDGTLASGDRDEKIRLTAFPTTVLIQGFLTGHTEFVTAVRLLGNDRAVSASGDGTVRLWDTKACKELGAAQMQNIEGAEQEGGEHEEMDVADEGGEPGEEPAKEGSEGVDDSGDKAEAQEGTSSSGGRRGKAKVVKLPQGPVPSMLAVHERGSLVIAACVGLPQLFIYALSDMELVQTVNTPAAPLGLSFTADDLLLVSVEAPVYLAVYRLDEMMVVEADAPAYVQAVRAYAEKHALSTTYDVDEAFRSGQLGKVMVTMPKEWNNRQRKDRFLEKRKRQRRGEGSASDAGSADAVEMKE